MVDSLGIKLIRLSAANAAATIGSARTSTADHLSAARAATTRNPRKRTIPRPARSIQPRPRTGL